MLFSSMEFLFLFFPITLGVCWLLPRRARNYWLLLASLFFYAWGEPGFVLVMAASIVFNYFIALFIEKHEKGSCGRKAFLIIGIAADIALLFVFKYLNFAIRTLHAIAPSTGAFIRQTYIALPIGISFFTFQIMSYVIDVYRGIPAQHNIAYLGLYISFFPQLVAGPIVRYTTIMDEIRERRATKDDFMQGGLRFLCGLSKKMLLANVLAELVHTAFSAAGPSVCMAWLGAVAYTLQIYFDFSGYSDMAIGMGRMFGFHFLENFDYPYTSRTLTEFWRRWHISLGSWFRDYVYFPMGGSRVSSKGRLILNLAVVWLLTGIWHGADWTFIIWGALHGCVIIIEKFLHLPQKLPERRLAGGLYRAFTLLAVILGWVLFRADTLHSAASYIGAMFGAGRVFADSTFVFYFKEYAVTLAAAILCATPVFRHLRERISAKGEGAALACSCAEYGVQLILLAVCVSFLVIGAYNPFIYFNF